MIITTHNRITRRSVLRGAGGVAIGLPSLSAMLRPGKSHAQGTTPQRFLVFYSSGGTVLESWRPIGTPESFTFGPMVDPLNPWKQKLVVVDGLDLKITEIGVGHPHSRGMAGVLTGRKLLPGKFRTNGGNASFADGISIDQSIAAKVSNGLRLKSLEVSAGWSTGLAAGGQPHPANIINYAGSLLPIPPATDPWGTFQRVFRDLKVRGTPPTAEDHWNKSILDGVADDYKNLVARLNKEDAAKLDAHLTMIRELETSIQARVVATCKPPVNVNSTPRYYDEQRVFDHPEDSFDTSGNKVPEKGRVMTDILVSALACDLTRVGTMLWCDSEANVMLTFLKDRNGKPMTDHHHGYQHDRGYQPDSLEIINNWLAGNFAYLLKRLDETPDDDGKTLLDNTLVIWVTDIQHPESHAQNNMPFILAGGAGGKLKTGRWLKVPSQPHNNLLTSLANLYGMPLQKYGDPAFCSGPMAGLV